MDPEEERRRAVHPEERNARDVAHKGLPPGTAEDSDNQMDVVRRTVVIDDGRDLPAR